jgi:Flavodoxin-like fold
MTIFGGGTPHGEQAAAWRAAQAAFDRFDAADRLLFSVPMWNASVSYILKQFIDVVSQPGMVFGVDARTGYSHLLQGKGKKAAVIYTSAVWGPRLGPEFGTNFHSTYFDDGRAGRESPTSPTCATTRRLPATPTTSETRLTRQQRARKKVLMNSNGHKPPTRDRLTGGDQHTASPAPHGLSMEVRAEQRLMPLVLVNTERGLDAG